MTEDLTGTPDQRAVDDALTGALLRGHAMGPFTLDPDLGWRVAACRACGLRLIRYADGVIAGPALLIECAVGRRIPPTRPHAR